MEMTKETVEARKSWLVEQRDEAVANAQALSGAIQDCDYWLGRIEAEKAKKAEAIPTGGPPEPQGLQVAKGRSKRK